MEIIKTGTDIPPEEPEHVFEKFFRFYYSGQHNAAGFGLGLPMIKRFCDLLNIKITLHSEINKYTIAKLIIPLHPDDSDNTKMDVGNRQKAIRLM